MISFNLSYVAYNILNNSIESLHTDKTLMKIWEQSQDHPQAQNNETKLKHSGNSFLILF